MTIPDVRFNHRKTQDAEFEVVDLHRLQRRAGPDMDPSQPHRIGFYNLILVESGRGEHMVDFVRHSFGPGSVILIQREQVQAFDFSQPLQGKVLLFTQTFLDRLHSNMRLPSFTPIQFNPLHQPVLNPDAVELPHCRALFDELAAEVERIEPDPLVVMYLFSALALRLNRLRPAAPHERLSETQRVSLARFYRQLEAQGLGLRDATTYASQIGVTYKTLNTLCKAATGLTAKQFVDAYVVMELKRRLILSQQNIQQLAWDCGFEDASNFTKYFKAHTGLTPKAFVQSQTQPHL
ncbi:AraC family transcriptional regulator [Marinobacter hydrocarbonoclasticus]|nr:AraC family transcriptional regulator [Marinobacter nauticus]